MKTQCIQIRISEKLKDQVTELAKQNEKGISEYIRYLIEMEVEKEKDNIDAALINKMIKEDKERENINAKNYL